MNRSSPPRAPGQILAHVRIVLSHPSHPGNIGASARAMKTMGLERLVLVAPHRFPHPDAIALASGATDILESARCVTNLDEALAGSVFAVGMTARRRDLSHPLVSLRDAAARAIDETRAGDIAFVFGTETFGLPNVELERCQIAATVPANPDYSSLNLAAAVQLAAYEIALAAQAFSTPRAAARQPATVDEVEAFYACLEANMVENGFLNPDRPKRLMTRLRRLFTRARLEKEEVNILRGILASKGRNPRD